MLLADDAPSAPGPRNAATLTPLGDGELLLRGGRASYKWQVTTVDLSYDSWLQRDFRMAGELLLHGGWRPLVSTYGDSHVLTVRA